MTTGPWTEASWAPSYISFNTFLYPGLLIWTPSISSLALFAARRKWKAQHSWVHSVPSRFLLLKLLLVSGSRWIRGRWDTEWEKKPGWPHRQLWTEMYTSIILVQHGLKGGRGVMWCILELLPREGFKSTSHHSRDPYNIDMLSGRRCSRKSVPLWYHCNTSFHANSSDNCWLLGICKHNS